MSLAVMFRLLLALTFARFYRLPPHHSYELSLRRGMVANQLVRGRTNVLLALSTWGDFTLPPCFIVQNSNDGVSLASRMFAIGATRQKSCLTVIAAGARENPSKDRQHGSVVIYLAMLAPWFDRTKPGIANWDILCPVIPDSCFYLPAIALTGMPGTGLPDRSNDQVGKQCPSLSTGAFRQFAGSVRHLFDI